MSDYWNTYNPHRDFESLLLPIGEGQQTSNVGSLNAPKAGYDPLWIYQKYGDRLRALPADLYDAVFEAVRGGTTNQFLIQYISMYSDRAVLNSTWVGEAKLYLTDLE